MPAERGRAKYGGCNYNRHNPHCCCKGDMSGGDNQVAKAMHAFGMKGQIGATSKC